MQQEIELLNKRLLSQVSRLAGEGQVVSFPVHRGSYHVEPIEHPRLFTCPAVIGMYKLERDARKIRPCQACGFCLPEMLKVC